MKESITTAEQAVCANCLWVHGLAGVSLLLTMLPLGNEGSLCTSFLLPHNFSHSPGLFAVIRIVYQGRVVGFIFDSTATWETGFLLRGVQPKGKNKWVDIVELVMCHMDQGSCWQTQIPWLNLLWLTFLLDPLTPGWLKDFIRKNDTGL